MEQDFRLAGLREGPTGGRTLNQGSLDGTRSYNQSRASLPGGQGNLRLENDNGAAQLPATDAEGRELVAKYIAGIRNPSGPSIRLSEEELVSVAFAIADKVFHDTLCGFCRVGIGTVTWLPPRFLSVRVQPWRPAPGRGGPVPLMYRSSCPLPA